MCAFEPRRSHPVFSHRHHPFLVSYIKGSELTSDRSMQIEKYLAPVPLTIFRSNLNFDQNLECSSLKYALPITTKFCTRHDSVTAVTCAQFHCDRLNIFDTRALQILVGTISLVGRAPGLAKHIITLSEQTSCEIEVVKILDHLHFP